MKSLSAAPSRLSVRSVPAEVHDSFVADRPASFLQLSGWGSVKPGWRAETLGWFDGDGELVGSALVVFWPLPLVNRSVAYIAEGPVIDWATWAGGDVLPPLVERLRSSGVSTVRVSPARVRRRWGAEAVKAAVGPGGRLADVVPMEVDSVGDNLVSHLARSGWVQAADGRGFPNWPRYSFRLDIAGRSEDEVLRAFNRQWRRGIRNADRAGVEVVRGGREGLRDFYPVYLDTARRDGFEPFPFDYFERIWAAFDGDDAASALELHVAWLDGEALAAMFVVEVGGVVGCVYGGSASHRRDAFASQALHWHLIRSALRDGCQVYDMRGVSESLDPADPKFGVVRFKLGTGGDAVETVGDWELALRPALHVLVSSALRLRGVLAARRAQAVTRKPDE